MSEVTVVSKDTVDGQSHDEGRIADFKALYYQINAKPDTDLKVFKEHRIVERNDIIELNRKLIEKINHYNVTTKIVTCSLVFTDDRVHDFGLWEQFLQMDWNVNRCTKSINLKWDFTILLPGYEIPQKHTLRIRIGSSLKPQEAFHLIMSGEEEARLSHQMVPVIAKVDFINQVIGSEFLSIVNEWYRALPLAGGSNPFSYRFLVRNINRLNLLVIILSMFAGAFAFYGITKFVLAYYAKEHTVSLSSPEFIRRAFFWWLISVIAMYFSNAIGNILVHRLDGKIGKLQPINSLRFTKADDSRINEIKLANNDIVKKIALEFLFTVSVSAILFFLTKAVNLITSLL